MDERKNPYAPGAGTQPPELAGRDAIIEAASVALDRIRGGLSARSFVFYGLRGVGKTVLLNHIVIAAEQRGHTCVAIEAPENRSLPALLIPALRSTLIQLSTKERTRAAAKSALRVLAGFLKAIKVKYGDIEASIDVEPESGIADSGDLTIDLTALMAELGKLTKDSGSSIVLAIDELQYIAEKELESLIQAFHRANQLKLPATMIAAGLPQLVGQLGRSKSYAERLFDFRFVDKLDDTAAKEALVQPARRQNVEYAQEAIDEILLRTQGYPYFLQEWGKHCWRTATESPIRADDARNATQVALAELDAGFFRVRLDRLTPTEKRYLRAMAELGAGPHRSGDIAEVLRKKVTALGPVRSTLIAKGMIFSPNHGDTAFTVPLFDGFMKRIMPKFEVNEK